MMLKPPQKPKQSRVSRRQDGNSGPSKRNGISRRFVVLLVVAVAVSLGWILGGFSLWPLLLANQALTKRDCDSVLRWIDVAEHLNANPASLAMVRARVYRRLGDLNAMDEELETALKSGAGAKRVDQERLLAHAQAGRLHEVEGQLKAWMNDPGVDGADLCDAYTNGLASQGRLAETQMLLNAWEAGFPTDPKPHLKRARIAEHAREYEAAEAEYRAALKKNAEYPAALYALGRLLLDRKRPKDSLPLFQLCSRVAPGTSPAARVGEASCLQSLGEVQSARQILEEVVRLDETTQSKAYLQVGFYPEGAPAALALGRLESSQQNYQAASKWLRRAVTADPYDLDARYAFAVALRGCGKKEEATTEFEHVSHVRKVLAETETKQSYLANHPDDVQTRYEVAMVYMQHQSPKLGIYWLQSVLAHNPGHEPSHRALAEYYEAHDRELASYASLAKYHRSMISHAAQEQGTREE